VSERTTSRVFSWAAVNTVIVIAALFPVLWILSLSLKSSETVTDGRLIPAKLSLDNYRGIFTGAGGDVFTKALVNSLGIALIATVTPSRWPRWPPTRSRA